MRNTKYAEAPRLPVGPEGKTDLDTVVTGSGELMLEIGPGRGAFALAYAQAHPDERLVALEIRRKWSQILDDRLAARKLTHARCFAEDAGEALPRMGPDGCVSRVAVHFPDPWWKKRHARRLVVQDGFVAQLGRLTRPGALVLVQTDVETRAGEYAARFDGTPWFERVTTDGQGYVTDSPFAPARSNREIRAIQDGLPVFRLVFRRR